jgi:nicotinamide-nucleotide amidase
VTAALADLKQLALGPPRLTLAAAESLTSGRVQARIGEISGASGFFLGGITAYELEQKVRHLGVDRLEAERAKCVSAAVAEQMACGVCRLFGADLGVATTGYAEPSPESGVAEPYAWWALAHRGTDAEPFRAVRSGRIECPGMNRVDTQTRVAEAVLGALVEYLRELRA